MKKYIFIATLVFLSCNDDTKVILASSGNLNEISIVVGDEWFAGNLSYHLSSRPKWFNTIENNLEIVDYNTGVIYTGNPKILKKSCPGVFGTIKPVGYCMIGVK